MCTRKSLDTFPSSAVIINCKYNINCKSTIASSVIRGALAKPTITTHPSLATNYIIGMYGIMQTSKEDTYYSTPLTIPINSTSLRKRLLYQDIYRLHLIVIKSLRVSITNNLSLFSFCYRIARESSRPFLSDFNFKCRTDYVCFSVLFITLSTQSGRLLQSEARRSSRATNGS